MKLIDQRDFAQDDFLKKLQGNILKGHGRDHTTHIFMRFKEGYEEDVRDWIKTLAEENLTSFRLQLKERDLYKKHKTPGSIFCSFYLTPDGYRYLGFDDVDERFEDAAFSAGMKNRLDVNQDPDTGFWEEGLAGEIHAMLLIADDDPLKMGKLAKELLVKLEFFAEINTVEYGNAIRNANGDGLEHFGYVDGVSQPLFLKDEVDDYMADHGIINLGTAPFDPTADSDLVLIEDPYDVGNNSFGSYFVFRKLEQNVREFKEAEENLGLGELGGAYIVGRFEDGSPVVLTDEEGMINSGGYNNFDYSSDPSGGKCPHFAHIRKTNPRHDFFDGDDHKGHIMARRGIPFGHRNVDTALDPIHAQMPTGGVGLLFMSYQKSIENQFEFIQNAWANNASFPPISTPQDTGVDIIIGHPHVTNPPPRTYNFPSSYGAASRTPLTVEQFVTMKGGEYFFAPSIPFLENL